MEVAFTPFFPYIRVAPFAPDVEEVLREKLLALASLQTVDLEIVALKKNSDAYPREIAEFEQQLAAHRSAVDAERQTLDDLARQRLTLEQTVSEDKDKVRKWEGRLAEQRSTREYAALAREIDIAKKGQQTMSEEIVELNRQAGVQREVLKQKDAELQGKSAELVEKVTQLKSKLDDVLKQISEVDARRSVAAKDVDGNLLKRYDVVRKKRVPALVPVHAPGKCSGCSMNIPAQMYNTMIASRAVEMCPSCSRMIYAETAVETK